MSLVMRKPVFGVFDQIRLKPICAATEASYKLEISDIETRDFILSRQRKTKVLIRRIMDISYPRRFVPKMIRTQVERFVPSGLGDSYPRAGRFVPNAFFSFLYSICYFRIQNCKIYSAYWVLVDSYPFAFHFPFLIWSFLPVFIHQYVIVLVLLSPITNPTKWTA